MAFLIILPLAPFVHKMHRIVFFIAILVLVVTTLNNVFAFPFDAQNPVKIRYKQIIDLDADINTVRLTGPSQYIRRIAAEIPSAVNSSLNCTFSAMPPLPKELDTCTWNGLQPKSASGLPATWMNASATLVKPGYANFRIQASESRFCKIHFASSVKNVHVNGSSGAFQQRWPIPSEGLRDLQLWSRTWDKEFLLNVGWDGDSGLSGRISCGWDDISMGKIPSFDEVKAFIPSWSTVTKTEAGLLELSRKFSL
jgi:hypothetical protein